MAEQIIPIQDIHLGGLSDSRFSGSKNSVYKLCGFDLHSVPGVLKVAQKLTKDTSTTITAFCKVAVSSSNGATYWFSSTDGKIWERTSAGVLRLVHTTSPAAGGAGCLGAAEYQGRIWWATESRLHYITVAKADDNNWAADAVEDEGTFGITDAKYHPMLEQNQVLYIGDGNRLSQVDVTTFTANALDIKTPLRISVLGRIGTDLLIGTYVADNVTKTEILRWNTWSVSFTTSDTIEEVGINAFIPGDNSVFVQAGLAGNIYFYNGEQLELYSKIPGSYTPTAYNTVHPNAVANRNGNMLIGVSNGSGNPCEEGVYTLGRHSRNYPYVLDFTYPISERATGALVTSSIEIGAILLVGQDVYVSWKNSTTYGVDKLDFSNKLSGAYLETRVILPQDRYGLSSFPKIAVPYYSLPASTDITIEYDANYAGSYTGTTEITDTDRKVKYAEEGIEASTLQVKVTTSASSNTAPEIESVLVWLK